MTTLNNLCLSGLAAVYLLTHHKNDIGPKENI